MLNAFLDLVFPRYCFACTNSLEVGEELLCTNCRFELPRTNTHHHKDQKLAQKFYGKVKIEEVLAYLYFVKGGKVQRLLHQLKYKGHQEIGEMLGRMYGSELKDIGIDQKLDLIVPVPLHPKKQNVRGYNQADCFAKGISEQLEIEWKPDVLKKGRPTESQTKQEGRYERFKNINEVFYVHKPSEVINKRIALVDDIVTTGSTLEACAAELLIEGAKEIFIITIATAT